MTEALKKLKGLWLQEMETERRRFRESRALSSLKERVESGAALSGLEVSETGASSGDRTILWVDAPSEGFRASTGTPLLLWWDEPKPESSVQAVLARRSKSRLGLVVDGFPPERLLTGIFNLDQEASETTFLRGIRAIETFSAAKPSSAKGRMVRVAFGESLAEEFKVPELLFFDEELNEPQRNAVRDALSTEPLALIHGPPGTGKTRTLVEVVRQALERGERVLISAASNAAVDNLAEKLIASGVDVVRLGHPARVAPELETHTLDARLEARPDFALAKGWMDEANRIRRRVSIKSDRGSMGRDERRESYRQARELMQDARRHLRNIEDAIVSQARVVASTAAGADANVLRDSEFDLVVIDEATQVPDPIALVALQRAPRAILAGDPHQLPPTILDLQASKAGLSETIFERLASKASLLEVQHRMHKSIMHFPSTSKYDGRLRAAPTVANHLLEDLAVLVDPLRPGPLVFVDTAGKGWDEEMANNDPSTRNPIQARRVASEVNRLLSRGISPDTLAVITPYFAQVRLLRELLNIEGLEVDTVDAFQGREKEAIVVDLVRSNPEGQLGFLADTRRMNVALTRARRFLLVVGDSATLGTHPYYTAFLNAVESHGVWVSAWSDDADPV